MYDFCRHTSEHLGTPELRTTEKDNRYVKPHADDGDDEEINYDVKHTNFSIFLSIL